jgi:hypothetical protein
VHHLANGESTASAICDSPDRHHQLSRSMTVSTTPERPSNSILTRIRALAVVIAVMALACNPGAAEPTEDPIGTPTVTEGAAGIVKVRMQLDYESSVGYGNVFAATVLGPHSLPIDGDEVTLVLLAGNTFVLAIEPPATSAAGTFTFQRTDRVAERRVAPMNGFADRELRVWEIINIEDIES